MANHNLSGFLRDPLGEFSKGDTIKFTHVSTTGEVIKGSQSLHKISDSGEYDINIEYGNVAIETRDATTGKWTIHGTTTINSSTTATTLPDLLNALVPASDPLILQLETILDDATQAKDDATQAKDDATQAKDDATQAKDDAVQAKDDATQAKDDATQAKDDAVQAKDDAVQAKDDAVQAKDDAEAAAASLIGGPLLPNAPATITALYSFDIMPNMGVYNSYEISDAVYNVKDMSNGGALAIRLGYSAGETSQSNFAVAVGPSAGNTGQGEGCVAIGNSCGSSNMGVNSISIGTQAGRFGLGSYSVAIGMRAGENTQPESSIVINSDNTENTPTATKQILIGRSDYNVKIGDGNVQSVSDARDKYDITKLPIGLDFINDLNSCFYKYDIRELYEETVEIKDEEGNVTGYKTVKHKPDGSKAGKRYHAGLIAQEVKETMDKHGVDFALFRDESIGATEAHKERASDKLALCYQELIPVLVRAVQELSEEVEALKGKK